LIVIVYIYTRYVRVSIERKGLCARFFLNYLRGRTENVLSARALQVRAKEITRRLRYTEPRGILRELGDLIDHKRRRRSSSLRGLATHAPERVICAPAFLRPYTRRIRITGRRADD